VGSSPPLASTTTVSSPGCGATLTTVEWCGGTLEPDDGGDLRQHDEMKGPTEVFLAGSYHDSSLHAEPFTDENC
jgi:hypothetical protein